MSVFHNTGTVILCALDILELTANQDRAVSIFLHPCLEEFQPEYSSSWRKSFKHFLQEEILFLHFGSLVGFCPFCSYTFCHSPEKQSLFLWLPHLYHQLLLLSHFLSPLLLPLFWTTPQGRQLSSLMESWPVTAVIFSLRDRDWICFSLSPPLAVVVLNRKTPVAELPH